MMILSLSSDIPMNPSFRSPLTLYLDEIEAVTPFLISTTINVEV
jgi:hypothetical protein